jgi:hypothetical protein
MKSKKRTTLVFPIDVLFDTLAKNFISYIDSIDKIGQNRSIASTFCALVKARLLSKQSRGLLDDNLALQFYLIFYMCLQTNYRPRHLLDGWPSGSLLHMPHGSGPSRWYRFDLLQPRDAVIDQRKTALKLASLSITDVTQRAGKYVPDDLPRGVGVRVAAFVGRSRFVSTFVTTKNPTKQFRCSVCQTRSIRLENTAPAPQNVFLDCGEAPTAVDHGGGDGSESDDSSDDELLMGNVPAAAAPARPQSIKYWQQAACSPFLSLPSAEFCCSACKIAYADQMAKLFPVGAAGASILENSKIQPQKTGLRRVAAAARAAGRRNDSLRRHTREIVRLAERGDITLFIPLELLKKMYSQIIGALDVDHGLLEAAACIAESPNLAINKTLPGTCANWRESHPIDFKDSLQRVKTFYQSGKREWVDSTKRHALDIFI